MNKSTKDLDECLPAGSGTTVGVHRPQTPLSQSAPPRATAAATPAVVERK